MGQSPCFDIEYWRSHRPLFSKKSKWNTITSRHYCVTLLNAIPYQKLSHWHDFQPHHPPFISTIHMPVFINQLLSAVLLKSTIVIFFIFNFAWTAQNSKKLATYTVQRVVRENLNYGLRVCRIFSCDNNKTNKTHDDGEVNFRGYHWSFLLILSCSRLWTCPSVSRTAFKRGICSKFQAFVAIFVTSWILNKNKNKQ